MKANKYDIAVKELGDKFGDVKIPETIREEDKDYFHVLMIESVAPSTPEDDWVHKPMVKKYGKRSWVAVKKKFVEIGVKKAIIFHNPESKVVEAKLKPEAGAKKTTEKKVETKAVETKAVESTGGNAGLDALKEAKEKAIELGWTGAKNKGLQVYLDYIAKAEKANKED